jgi:hypothetical protein
MIPVSDILIPRSMVHPNSIDGGATKPVIDGLVSYDSKIAEFFHNKNNKQFPIFHLDSPGLTTDMFDTEDVKQVDDQYKTAFSMLEVENMTKKSLINFLAQVLLQRVIGLELDMVIGRNCDQDGNLVGHGRTYQLLYTKYTQCGVSRWMYSRIS